MSVELVLIPLALAAVSAARAAKMESPRGVEGHVQVQSRLKHGGLLAAALRDVGATTVEQADESLLAIFPKGALRMTRTADEPWVAHFGGMWSEEDAIGLIADVDAAYGLHVQRTVLARLREQAPAAGMLVESERVEDDQTVTMMLRVNA